jgi:hypothetical protein
MHGARLATILEEEDKQTDKVVTEVELGLIDLNFINNKVYKIGNNVFVIGSIDFHSLENKFSKNFFIDICNILNKGSKFIPCFYDNNFLFFSNILNTFGRFLEKLNSRLFFINNNSYEINQEYLYLTRNNIDVLNKEKKFFNKLDSDFISSLLTDLNKNFIGLRSYPLQFELIDLEFELFKNFNKFKFRSVNNNITKSEYISIKNFIKFKPFKVVQVDKNLGTAIVSNNDYDNLCLDHLNNNEFFEKVNQNPLIDTVSIINNELTDLKINKQISKSIFNKCFVPKPRLGKFRILMKLHKPPKLSTRPIVNCINHPTSKIAYIIDYILQPYVKNTESYLKDSQHLLNDFKDLIINQVYDMYTLDFENLYMNLILNHMSTVISEYMSDKFETNDLKIGGFNGLLKLVLFHNYISFSNKFYLQIKGIAMGCKCAPVLANLYLYLLEKKFLFIHKPFFYKRYLDDLFLIIHKDFNIELLYGFFENLKLTISCKNGVVNFFKKS